MLGLSAKAILFILASAAAIAMAAMFDQTIAQHVRAAGTEVFLRDHVYLREIMKSAGVYPFTIILAALITRVHPRKWWAGIFLLIATSTSALNTPIQSLVGRARPFKTIGGDSEVLTPFDLHPLPGLWVKNLCFPSGHATLAFATAAALSILWPRGRWVFYPLAIIVAAERVLENAHWLSDVVAAAALGFGGVWIVRRLLWDNRKWGNRNDQRITLPLAGDTSL